MKNNTNKRKFKRLPAPLGEDIFTLFKTGISNSNDINVWVNEGLNFACLDPVPEIEYSSYKSRVNKYNLSKYKNPNAGYLMRLEKIRKYISNSEIILDVGASNGQFLECIENEFPSKKLYAVEPDQETLIDRKERGLKSYNNIKDFKKINVQVDIVGLFHVFEHLIDPTSILKDISGILNSNGKLIIEVPALSDPLLSLYEIPEFMGFYFQDQHPYVYSSDSLKRVLKYNNFSIIETIPFQRYGLENNLSWLKNRRPGGDSKIAKILCELDSSYRKILEINEITDTVIVIAEMN